MGDILDDGGSRGKYGTTYSNMDYKLPRPEIYCVVVVRNNNQIDVVRSTEKTTAGDAFGCGVVVEVYPPTQYAEAEDKAARLQCRAAADDRGISPDRLEKILTSLPVGFFAGYGKGEINVGFLLQKADRELK